MSIKGDGQKNTESAKVLQLGFNISVSGDPGTDFQIVLDDSGQKAVPTTSQNETDLPSLDILSKARPRAETSKRELEINTTENKLIDNTSGILKRSDETTSQIGQNSESPPNRESNLINEIKSTLEHFEKFSTHLKDVPRLRGHPTATSTPLSDKDNSKSESNLLYPQFRHRRSSHLYDYNYKKSYFIQREKPDLFLKPLPGENLYRSGFYTRYKADSLRHYVSDSNLNKPPDKPVCEKSKYDVHLDTPGILKKLDSESGDKHSTSSAESIKDIKIYQSGGILIMQNFKENMDAFEKKEISNFSAKLIENCSRLKEEVNNFQDNRVKGIGLSSDEGRNPGKVVQFDLSEFENQKSKSGDSSSSASKAEKISLKQGSSDSISDSTKLKDSSPQGTSQIQDFLSLSTVENDSTISNQFGLSPTYSSTKKLEWDSGADVGYFNSDLSKESLSRVEKYVLSHLSSDSFVNERSLLPDFSKFAQVRIASEKLIDDIREERRKEQQKITITEKKESCKHDIAVVDLSDDESVKNAEVAISKGSKQSKCEKPKPVTETPVEKDSRSMPKAVKKADKSMNVNTLFENVSLNPSPRAVTYEDMRNVDVSNRKSPKVRKFRKSKPSYRKVKCVTPKKRFSLDNLNKYELPVFGMGVPKGAHKKVERNPEIRDVELSREVEEIVIDQRFKIKQNLSAGTEIKKLRAVTDEENNHKRPVSGSSSSNNTVLPNVENKEVLNTNKFSDQTVQTSGLDCESVGVQAFESQKSSNCSSRTGDRQQKAPRKTNNVHLSSKNIQAFGLNASLPKELAHPKETNFPENQFTKSTQYFGGPINSLPNYHSSLITKPAEACGRVSKVLSTKKRAEAEMMRLNEENKKNILTNDSQRINPRSSTDKNKENLLSKNSKRSHSSPSQTSKDAGSPEKKNVEGSDLKSDNHSSLMENADYLHTSDEVSSKVLTSEVLKEHGDSIDRNIIQEKYFESQLIELKKKEMISKSTSVDLEIDGGRVEKECVSASCQYSSPSRDVTSEEESKDEAAEGDVIEKSKEKSERTETTDQNDSTQNNMEELLCTSKSTNQGQIAGDSLPSSTQTVNSWIPRVQNSEQDKGGVGRARSFEYLPGHIYEGSGNLTRGFPNETEENSMSSSSTGKHSIAEGRKDSEGSNTLILKNSTNNSHESNQLKILDENLTQLNLVVSELWEKEAVVKNLNQSLLLNLLRKNGSGDNIGPAETSQTEVPHTKNFLEHRKEGGDASSELNAQVKQKSTDTSTEHQIEKSLPEYEKFYQRRRVLEKRISEEKQNQIKWIENEIHHLNILRGLLEKQSFTHQKCKRRSPGSETQNDISKSDTENSKHNVNENYSGPVTPVYGCTISLTRNSPSAGNSPVSEEIDSQGQQENVNVASSDPVLYGMSVSVRNVAVDAYKNLQRIVTLPVGVQISVKNSGSGRELSNSEGESEKNSKGILKSHPGSSGGNSLLMENLPCGNDHIPQKEAYTQFPSSRRNSLNLPSTSVQTDFGIGNCNQCRRPSCFCLNLSERSLQSASPSSKVSERRGSLRCSFRNEGLIEENKTSSSTDAELLEVRSCPNSKLPKQTKISVKSNGKLPSSESFQKPHCVHVKECRNHVQRRHSQTKFVNQEVCQNSCQSNATSNSERSDNFPSCHCSKIQVQKFSACACHIIKLMETKCSAENESRQCKKRTLKTTENQSCQTDEVTIVTKELVNNPQFIKASRAQDVVCLCEKKIATEKKKAILQKLPNDQKTSFEKRPSYDKKLEVLEKVGVVKRCPEFDVPVKKKALESVQLVPSCEKGAEKEVKIDKKIVEFSENARVETKALQTDQTCTCFEAFQKKIDKDDGRIEESWGKTVEENYRCQLSRETLCEKSHPRHYFLKLEETEIDDSEESLEPKNSLEVITVKIPVKKAGKGKIYNPKCPKPYQVNQNSKNFRKKSCGSKSCRCCQVCRGYSPKSTEYTVSSECRRIEAEKPQSPERFRGCHPTPVSSSEDMGYQHKCDNHQRYEKSCSTQAECYCDRSSNSQDNTPEKDIQIENDCHQKHKCNLKSNTQLSSFENGKNQERQEKFQSQLCHDIDEIELNNQNTPYLPQTGCRCDSDYYNYDRLEYMTKSELLKEQKKKQKTQSPSLQEYLCRNRPDFYDSAERRRKIITEKAKERIIRHENRMECLMNLIHSCNNENRCLESGGEKRIFTTSEMRGQTMKRYKNLPEVTGKIADQKKKEKYRTNKLVADIYSKKLQIETLKGHLNLSNSISVLATI